MTRMQRVRPVEFLAALLCLLLFLPQVHAQDKGKKEYEFHGKVEKVDPKAKTLTVNGEKVEGWMPAMTMTYSVDKSDVIGRVKAGDRITAKVHEGDFMKLYDVRVTPPARK